MRSAFAVAIVMFSVIPARSDSYTYLCKSNNELKVLTVNEDKHELVWERKSYRIKVDGECAKYGWTASRGSDSFEFCTATRGYADFQLHGVEIRCDQYLSAVEAERIYSQAR